MINIAKSVHDIMAIQQWMDTMEDTIQQAQNLEAGVGPSKPPPNVEDHDSDEECTAIKRSSAPMFSIDNENNDDIQ